MSGNKKFEVDPRILANTQKILQYLSRIAEDQQKLKQALKITMNETQKFQNDVYESFRILDGDVCKAFDNIESLHEVTDHISSRVKSIHRHVKGIHSTQELSMNDSSNVKVLNSAPHRGSQNQMNASSRLPKTTLSYDLPSRGKRMPMEKYIPNDGSLTDSDTDANAIGATGNSRMSNSLNPNLLQRAPRGATGKASNQLRLSPLLRSEGPGQQVQAPNIQEPANQSMSPLHMASQPPKDTHRPNTRKGRETAQPGVFDVSAIKRTQKVKPPLIQAQPREDDIRTQLERIGVEISPASVAAITKACCRGNVTASRTVGLHTMLVLDTSASMEGHPLNTMKTFVNGMLDSIDVSAGEYGLEEHIAMVTFGSTVDVEQPFTNDFMAVRNKLDNLAANGRTPLLTALSLALFYLEINGETVEMFKHKIPPRVIVMSDFQVTNDRTFEGSDADTSEVRIKAQRQVFKIAELFQTCGYPIYWVPVGENRNQAVVGEVCKRSRGSIVEINMPDVPGNFYRYQTIIGSALHQYNLACEAGQEEDVNQLLQQFLPQVGLTTSDTEAVEELLAVTLERSDDDDIDEMSIESEDMTEEPPVLRTSPSHGQPRIETPVNVQEGTSPGHQASGASPAMVTPPSRTPTQTARTLTPQMASGQAAAPEPTAATPYLPEWTLVHGLDQVGFDERADLPLIGTRVVRGKDWKWDDQDGKGPGTVVGHRDKGLVFIVWDNTDSLGIFRYKYEDMFDIEVHNEPRSVEEGRIEIGCWVVRGPDWTKGDEDGGTGTVGVVIRKLPNRIVQVRWPSRVIESYSFGADNKWELKVTMTKALHDFQSAPSEIESAPTDASATDMTLQERPTVPGEEEATVPAWYWLDQSKQWRIFSEEAILKIQSMFEKKPDGNVMVHRNNTSVKVFLGQMQCEMNEKRTMIKRDFITENEMKSLQELDTFLSAE